MEIAEDMKRDSCDLRYGLCVSENVNQNLNKK